MPEPGKTSVCGVRRVGGSAVKVEGGDGGTVVPGVGFESASGGPFFRDIDNQGGEWLAVFLLFVAYWNG